MTSPSRFTHVIRICGQDRDGNQIPDIWVDIERQDVVWVNYKEKETGHWQSQFMRLYWMDDPDSSDGSWNKNNRVIGTRYICSPEQNSYDPDEFIAVNCIVAMAFGQNGGDFGQGEGGTLAMAFRSDRSNQTRRLSARRIYNRKVDGNFDDDARQAFENDTSRFAYVVAGPDYVLKMDDEDKDDGQWLDVCVFAQSEFSENDGLSMGSLSGHWSTYLLDISDKSSDFLPDDNYPNAIGDLGFNPPWVLDQFQNIVNCQLGAAIEFEWEPKQLVFDHDYSDDGTVQAFSEIEDSYFFTYSGFIKINHSGVFENQFADDSAKWNLFHSISDKDFWAANKRAAEAANAGKSDPFVLQIYEGIRLEITLNGEDDTVIFNVWQESEPIDLNPLLIDIGEPFYHESTVGGDPFPVIVPYDGSAGFNKCKVYSYYGTMSAPAEEFINKPFHLFVTLDTTEDAEYTQLKVEYIDEPDGGIDWDSNSDYIGGAMVNVWVNGRSIYMTDNSTTHIEDGDETRVEINDVDDTAVDMQLQGTALGGGGSDVSAFIGSMRGPGFIEKTIEHVLISPGDDDHPPTYTDVTATMAVQVPKIPGQKIPWSNMYVGVPFAYKPGSYVQPDPGEKYDDSIIMQDVMVWTNQIINPDDIERFFINPDTGNSRGTSLAIKEFGNPAFVLNGGPKSFINNKGTGPEQFGPFGHLKSHGRLTMPKE